MQVKDHLKLYARTSYEMELNQYLNSQTGKKYSSLLSKGLPRAIT